LSPSVPTGSELGAGEAHAFVADLDRPELLPEDRHHLERVLRLRTDAPITISDGKGAWRWAAFGPTLAVQGEIALVPLPEPAVTVGFALLKGERPELVVQKLTEIGVDRIVPVRADRCVVHWDGERAERHLARLQRVAREAAMQCRRAWLPEIRPVATTRRLAAEPGAVLADASGDAPDLSHPLVLVGPEGGWSDAERELAVPRVALGPHVLRAETAAIVAGSLLVARRAGLL
jgi:16S rRNA (uracil1498-N3)-methyltransferase